MAPNWYSGPCGNFPSMDKWISFDDMFERNKPSMLATGSTNDDVERVRNAIKECAQMGVEERVILAIIMQESHGDVGVRTTFSPGEGVPTGGLMQCWMCMGNPGQHGISQEAITDMVRKGTEHYKENLKAHGDQCSVESIYPALRDYNSGSSNPNDLSDGRGATPSYVSDIANRLEGWVN